MPETYNSKGISKTTIFLLIGLIGYFLLPSFSAGLNKMLAALFLCGLILYLVSVRDLYRYALNFRRVISSIAICFMFLCAQYLYVVLEISEKGTAPTFATIKFILLFLIMVPLYGAFSQRQKRIILSFTVLFTIMVMMLVALTSSGGRPTADELIQNQTTQFATGTMFLSGIMFSVFLTTKSASEKRSSAIVLIICVLYNLLVAQKGIVLLMSVMIFAALALCSWREATLKEFLVVLIVLACVIIMILLFKEIITWLAENIQSQRLSVRLNRLLVLFDRKSFDAAGGSVAGRYRLIRQSVISWKGSFKTIVFGVGEHRGNEIIGHHGQLIDYLASYGLICMPLLIGLLKSMWNNICFEAANSRNSIRELHFKLLFLFFILRGLIGITIHSAVGVYILIVLPLTFSLMNEEEYA